MRQRQTLLLLAALTLTGATGKAAPRAIVVAEIEARGALDDAARSFFRSAIEEALEAAGETAFQDEVGA